MINYEELESQSFLVNENDENERIDKFLAKIFDNVFLNYIQELF